MQRIIEIADEDFNRILRNGFIANCDDRKIAYAISNSKPYVENKESDITLKEDINKKYDMTNEEAISTIEEMATSLQIIPDSKQGRALTIALLTLNDKK